MFPITSIYLINGSVFKSCIHCFNQIHVRRAVGRDSYICSYFYVRMCLCVTLLPGGYHCLDTSGWERADLWLTPTRSHILCLGTLMLVHGRDPSLQTAHSIHPTCVYTGLYCFFGW